MCFPRTVKNLFKTKRDYEKIFIITFATVGLIAVIVVLVMEWSVVNNRPLMLSGAVFYFSVYLGLFIYFWTKRTDRFKFGNEKRHEFIFKDKFTDLRSRIEHDDRELLTVVAATNVPDPYKIRFYKGDPTEEKKGEEERIRKLHEDFDDYLNWIEGFAIMWKRNLIEHSELQGFWRYYIKRLREVNINEDELRTHLSQEWNYTQEEINQLLQLHRQTNVEYDPIDEKRGVKNPINPTTNPIWFYINRKEYEFNAIKELEVYLHSDVFEE